ncbi:hypothetical protein EV356DRAFT_543010 [Viridothelium virens]|uniref:Uncharacterized protein n=1 Tax=Viridothelium virens TaxID=1048519 RepID=A0A6A6HDD8_VIRVR|nr:hypothetical protein EV356DRAFT_543010 [Viridothelium virens]
MQLKALIILLSFLGAALSAPVNIDARSIDGELSVEYEPVEKSKRAGENDIQNYDKRNMDQDAVWKRTSVEDAVWKRGSDQDAVWKRGSDEDAVWKRGLDEDAVWKRGSDEDAIWKRDSDEDAI